MVHTEWDTSGDGALEREDFRRALQLLSHFRTSGETIDELYEVLDVRSYHELADAVARMTRRQSTCSQTDLAQEEITQRSEVLQAAIDMRQEWQMRAQYNEEGARQAVELMVFHRFSAHA